MTPSKFQSDLDEINRLRIKMSNMSMLIGVLGGIVIVSIGYIIFVGIIRGSYCLP